MKLRDEPAHPLPDARSGPAGQPKRPAVAEPVTYDVPWLLYLTIVSLVIAWLVPVTYLASRLIWPPVARGPCDAYAFVALAYSGISTKTNEVSPALFREHVRALKRHGYVPITLEDVRALLKDNKPVPRKAVLLTMDHSRKTSYFLTKSFLRRSGWNAVMFLWTRIIEENDPAALLWPYVRALVRSGNWAIGAQSENGYQKVPADPFNKTGHFMTTRMWLDAEKRYETFEELAERLELDHRRCLATIERNVGQRPIAYAYPYGDFGQYERREREIRRINLSLAGRYYELAFLTGNFALNTRLSDPRRLNRLRVRPEWSGQDLVQMLERAWPREEKRAFTNAVEAASAWIVDWGTLKIEKTRLVLESNGQPKQPEQEGNETPPEEGNQEWLVLQALEKITGARMWMAGSDQRQDLYWRIPFRLINGQMGVFLRATPEEEQYVYLGLDTAGSTWLRQKHVGLAPFTLASTKTRLNQPEDNVLEIHVRGALFGALLNGVPLFSESLKLRGAPSPGMIGISVWDTQKGRARLEIGEVVVSPQEPTLVSWKEDALCAPFHTRWIHHNGFRITHLSPSWLTVSFGGYVSRLAQDSAVIPMLTRMYQLKRLPRVEITWDRWANVLTPALFARQVKDINADGAFVDFSSLDAVPISTLTSWLQQVLDAFMAQGLQLAVRMPRLLENPAVLQPIIATLPGLQLAVTSDSRLRRGIPGAERSPMLVEVLPNPQEPEDIPFVNLIERSIDTRELSIPERIRLLHEEGKAALLANKYEEAIALWSKWHELDPGDATPLMLIGEVYLQMGAATQALEFYNRALDLDPGRITLAMRRAALLESLGHDEEALDQINFYARLFPENSTVVLAQAEWLIRHNRESEARDLILRVLARTPDNLDLLIGAIRFAATRQDRREYIRSLNALLRNPDLHLEFGEALEKYNLLGMADADLLLPLIEEIAQTSADPQVAQLFKQFRSLHEPVVEDFTTGRLSDAWRLDGGEAIVDNRSVLRIRVGAARREFAGRLRGSELIQNGFVEADLVDHAGEFWLMARRGPNQFIRFGFDAQSMLFLQGWKNGRRFANQRRYLSRLPRPVNLRLVVRGNGALGYVDGQPAFESPISIPRDIGGGAWGFTVFSSEPGQGMASLSSLAAGPLPLIVGVLPPPNAQERLFDILKLHVRDLSVLAPRWFMRQPDGTFLRQVTEQDEMVYILARFHGLKLLPLIDMAGRESVNFAELFRLANEHRVDGFCLLLPWMPSEKWVKEAEEETEKQLLDLLLIVPGEDPEGPAVIRGVGPSASLFAGQGPEPKIHVQYLPSDEPFTPLPPGKNILLMLAQTPPEQPPDQGTAPRPKARRPAARTPASPESKTVAAEEPTPSVPPPPIAVSTNTADSESQAVPPE